MRRSDAPVLPRLLALVVSGACLCGAGFAADPAAPKAVPKAPEAKAREGSLGKGTGPLLTREQLRQCMAEQERLRTETAAVVQARRQVDTDQAEIDRTGAALKTKLEALDRTSQAAVDDYNADVQARAKLIDAYKAAAPLFNDRVEKLDDARKVWTKDCADRRYREDDLDAIKAGK